MQQTKLNGRRILPLQEGQGGGEGRGAKFIRMQKVNWVYIPWQQTSPVWIMAIGVQKCEST